MNVYLKLYGIILALFLLNCTLQLKAQVYEDYIYFYSVYEGNRYYLSARDGGGDELITKKLSSFPGINEIFFLTCDMGFGQCRILTRNNYFVSFTDDNQLIASERELNPSHNFTVKMKESPKRSIFDYTYQVSVQQEKDDTTNLSMAFSSEEENFGVFNTEKGKTLNFEAHKSKWEVSRHDDEGPRNGPMSVRTMLIKVLLQDNKQTLAPDSAITLKIQTSKKSQFVVKKSSGFFYAEKPIKNHAFDSIVVSNANSGNTISISQIELWWNTYFDFEKNILMENKKEFVWKTELFLKPGESILLLEDGSVEEFR